jgi:hypothetical protein
MPLDLCHQRSQSSQVSFHSDEILVMDAQLGDRDAFDKLVLRWQKRLCGTRSISPDEEGAPANAGQPRRRTGPMFRSPKQGTDRWI